MTRHFENVSETDQTEFAFRWLAGGGDAYESRGPLAKGADHQPPANRQPNLSNLGGA
jgi:hypothetical protein